MKKNSMQARYERAQTLMQGYWAREIVPNCTVYPVWIEGSDCFWFETHINLEESTSNEGSTLKKWDMEYRLVDAAVGTNDLAFDHAQFASVLAAEIGGDVNADQLPITNVVMELNQTNEVSKLVFNAFDKRWAFNPQEAILREIEKSDGPDVLMAPDGEKVIFRRDHNLFIKSLATGKERRLTDDGEEFNCYASVGNAWGHEADNFSGLQARWSADSKRIFTVKRDTRQVKTIPIVEHVPRDGSVRPKSHDVRIAMQGDEHVPEYRLVAIEVATGVIMSADYPQIPITRNSWGFFASNLGWWSTDSWRTYFVHVERDYKSVKVIEFDTRTGGTRVLFEETVETHINLMLNADEFPTLLPLPETSELIWFSERTGWAHLYLYDLKTGDLKNPITAGNWIVRDILSFDPTRRELFVQAMGREKDRDPYYSELIRVNIDSGSMSVIASGDFDLACNSAFHMNLNSFFARFVGKRDISGARSVSHSGNYAVVTCSRADSIPVSILFDRNGKKVIELEKGNLSRFRTVVSDRWQWPEPVKLLAADEKTDIYGLVYRPSDFDPDCSYPVVSHVFNTPELPFVPKGSFSNDGVYGRSYLEAVALAELGFIVVQIAGRGTPYRDKAFHDQNYGWIEWANKLEDHVAGIRQLAKQYPYMDLCRVGISSLGGGPGAVQGLLQFPAFYKVGAGGMLHDSRLMPTSMWSDMFEGLDGPSSKHKYPESLASNLEGKLLMIHGMLDDSSPSAGTFRVVEALQKANKDFDLLLLPNLGHGMNSYVIRRSWDHLVRHLQMVEPPSEFNLVSARDLF